MVTLTDKAKKYMKSVIMNGDKVSLAVKGGGCSGFQYVWGLMNDHPDVEWSAPIDEVLRNASTVSIELGMYAAILSLFFILIFFRNLETLRIF